MSITNHQRVILESSASVGDGKLDLSDPEISQAYEKVRSGGSNPNWVLFSYAGKSNAIKVVATGDDGLDGLMEELTDGKIFYAFLRMDEPAKKISKFVYITYVPDGVPSVRKGVVHLHIKDMAAFLKGFHVQINARYESDLSHDAIQRAVTRASGANYDAQA
eukprot:TRINITY_DN1851_c0_g1_i1.p1 TRINITY_DN1851_c0_g1~~TRINITY_DN1851_c0_g1_i1.p1  ORF type:complete len:162 (-),score=33.85 TRINITY_DN1851_c0_g1_i1:65-550(-)